MKLLVRIEGHRWSKTDYIQMDDPTDEKIREKYADYKKDGIFNIYVWEVNWKLLAKILLGRIVSVLFYATIIFSIVTIIDLLIVHNLSMDELFDWYIEAVLVFGIPPVLLGDLWNEAMGTPYLVKPTFIVKDI